MILPSADMSKSITGTVKKSFTLNSTGNYTLQFPANPNRIALIICAGVGVRLSTANNDNNVFFCNPGVPDGVNLTATAICIVLRRKDVGRLICGEIYSTNPLIADFSLQEITDTAGHYQEQTIDD